MCVSVSPNNLLPQLISYLCLLYILCAVAAAYPEKYRPAFYIFGAVQDVIEHYADVCPQLATLGPILIQIGVILLGIHYYFANKVIANKAIVWGGFVTYLILLIVAKSQEWG